MSAPPTKSRVFRLPRTTYIVVIFLAFGIWPIALYGGQSGGYSSGAQLTPLIALFVLPVIVGLFVARTATVVTEDGIVVRAPFGTRALPWNKIRGLSVTGRSVYAVLADGSIRLPCVRVSNLADVARASNGRLPEIADPTPKFAPSRRRRR
ncbi:MAG: hypothetical protein QOJ78_1938 [Pseudonocardiales bacterium]|nr:hypothetical protein [Pseudonocardiales bacterium]